MSIIQSGIEAEEKGRIGGIKSGESRRKRKAVREIMQTLLYSKLTDNESLCLKNAYPSLAENEITVLDEILVGAIKKAQKSNNIKDIQELLKIAGLYNEKQTIKISEFNLFQERMQERQNNLANA